MINAAILTISDSCSEGNREDVSAQTINKLLEKNNFKICDYKIIPDDLDVISGELKRLADKAIAEVIITTGGTGLGPRDNTPEATIAVCDKLVPGFGEIMRSESLKKTRNATLSRSVSGIRKNSLIINLPGSPKGASECLEIILDILPHAIKMMQGHGH